MSRKSKRQGAVRANEGTTPADESEREPELEQQDADVEASAEEPELEQGEGDDAEPEAPPPAAGPAVPRTYRVAAGHSVTSRRGLLAAGREVEARDFAGGAERLAELAERGVLVRR